MRIKTVFIVAVLAVLAGSTVFSKTPRQKHREERLKGQNDVLVRPIELNIVPSIRGGYLIGKAADLMEHWDENVTSKILYGGGICLDYYPKERYALGASVMWGWKQIPKTDLPALRNRTLGATFTYNLTCLKRQNPYLRFLVGTTSIWLPDGDNSRGTDYGSHLTLQAAFGLLSYSGAKGNFIAELYYERISWEDGDAIEYVGFRVGLGIPIYRKAADSSPTNPSS